MSKHAHHNHHHRGEAPAGRAKDPVCGMTVDTATAAHKAEHSGVMYYFCAAG